MNTLLILHITLMIVSLTATISSVVASLFSLKVLKGIMITNIIATIVGILSGALLLLHAPLGSRCAVLITYTAMFAAVQVLITKRNQRLAASLDS